MMPDYDAILIVSFGGPEGPDEIVPFLENVLRGRNVPRERLLEVAGHYRHCGGRSPINDHCRGLIAALEARLARAGLNLPVYWGNRNWRPFLTDTVRQMTADGIRRARAFATSAYASYSGCRQYLENIAAARAEAAGEAPRIDKARPFHDHPLFIRATAARITAARERLPAGRLVCTAHSLPLDMAKGCLYEQQVRETARLAADSLGISEWDLVWQSRSGPPRQPWLAPDICDHLRSLHAAGFREVVVAPIGFLSDHVEVLYDLDVEAAAVASGLGMTMVRAETVGIHPDMVELVFELVTTGDPAPCPVDCCPAPGIARSSGPPSP
jgi:ferrochelatase